MTEADPGRRLREGLQALERRLPEPDPDRLRRIEDALLAGRPSAAPRRPWPWLVLLLGVAATAAAGLAVYEVATRPGAAVAALPGRTPVRATPPPDRLVEPGLKTPPAETLSGERPAAPTGGDSIVIRNEVFD